GSAHAGRYPDDPRQRDARLGAHPDTDCLQARESLRQHWGPGLRRHHLQQRRLRQLALPSRDHPHRRPRRTGRDGLMHFLSNLLVNIILTTPLVGAYTMFALGIVFIYRASRVLNLAHGAMAMFPAFLAFSMAGAVGAIPAAIAATLAGGVLGLLVERVVVRRLRPSGATSQTVGTVA